MEEGEVTGWRGRGSGMLWGGVGPEYLLDRRGTRGERSELERKKFAEGAGMPDGISGP